MANDKLIRTLAERLGIQSDYLDYEDKPTAISIEHQALVLEAMGYDTSSDNHLMMAIDQIDQEDWQTLLAPIHISPASTPTFRLCVAQEDSGKVFEMRVQLESGKSIQQRFIPEGFTQIASQNVLGSSYQAYQIQFDQVLAEGYHQLTITHPSGETSSAQLVLTPEQCYEPDALAQGEKLWGPVIQLYTLKSRDNQGIGDFSDLQILIEKIKAQGGDIIGLNPIHSLYPAHPLHVSPYSPANRRLLNSLYIDLNKLDDLTNSTEGSQWLGSDSTQAELERLRSTDRVDYEGVAALKTTAFQHAWDHFKATEIAHTTERANAFSAFCEANKEALILGCTYEALQIELFKQDMQQWGWPVWPDEYKDPHSSAVQAWIEGHQDTLDYYQYLQWQAELQLEATHAIAQSVGMKVGMYRDLAVGFDMGGSEAWLSQDSYAIEASIGCPPDKLGPEGQKWGLPPVNPRALKASGYAPFLDMIRTNMQNCGCLRIDHAMALYRLWWCPPGKNADSGAFVHYPMDELLGLLKLESHRHKCLLIGEDLGTVPDAVDQAFPEANVYSSRIFFMETESKDELTPLDQHKAKALTVVTNHDIPTLPATWSEYDLTIRQELGLIADDAALESASNERKHEKWLILKSLEETGLLPDGMSVHPDESPELTQALSEAIHTYVAQCSSQLMGIQLEDFLGIKDPVNLPGVSSQDYPCWSRKLTVDVEDMFEQPEVKGLVECIRKVRG